MKLRTKPHKIVYFPEYLLVDLFVVPDLFEPLVVLLWVFADGNVLLDVNLNCSHYLACGKLLALFESLFNQKVNLIRERLLLQQFQLYLEIDIEVTFSSDQLGDHKGKRRHCDLNCYFALFFELFVPFNDLNHFQPFNGVLAENSIHH